MKVKYLKLSKELWKIISRKISKTMSRNVMLTFISILLRNDFKLRLEESS